MSLLRSLGALVLGLMLAVPAQAAAVYTVPTSGSGTISIDGISSGSGSLAGNTQLTLVFQLGSNPDYNFYMFEDVSLAASLDGVAGQSTYAATNGVNYNTGSLLVSTVTIDNLKQATIVLNNTSSAVANFFTQLTNFLSKFGGLASDTATLHYSYVSTVPLPASFYMFGIALAALFYVGSRRKNASDIG